MHSHLRNLFPPISSVRLVFDDESYCNSVYLSHFRINVVETVAFFLLLFKQPYLEPPSSKHSVMNQSSKIPFMKVATLVLYGELQLLLVVSSNA